MRRYVIITVEAVVKDDGPDNLSIDEMMSIKESGKRFPTMRFLSNWNNGLNLPLVKAFFNEAGIPSVKGWSQSGIKAALENWANPTIEYTPLAENPSPPTLDQLNDPAWHAQRVIDEIDQWVSELTNNGKRKISDVFGPSEESRRVKMFLDRGDRIRGYATNTKAFGPEASSGRSEPVNRSSLTQRPPSGTRNSVPP